MRFNRSGLTKQLKELTLKGLIEDVQRDSSGGYSFRLTELGKKLAAVVEVARSLTPVGAGILAAAASPEAVSER